MNLQYHPSCLKSFLRETASAQWRNHWWISKGPIFFYLKMYSFLINHQHLLPKVNHSLLSVRLNFYHCLVSLIFQVTIIIKTAYPWTLMPMEWKRKMYYCQLLMTENNKIAQYLEFYNKRFYNYTKSNGMLQVFMLWRNIQFFNM